MGAGDLKPLKHLRWWIAWTLFCSTVISDPRPLRHPSDRGPAADTLPPRRGPGIATASSRVSLAGPPEVSLLVQLRQFPQTLLQLLPSGHPLPRGLIGIFGDVIARVPDDEIRRSARNGHVRFDARAWETGRRFRQYPRPSSTLPLSVWSCSSGGLTWHSFCFHEHAAVKGPPHPLRDELGPGACEEIAILGNPTDVQ